MMEEDRLVKKKTRAKRDGDVHMLAEVLKDLGDLYFESGRLNEALQEYQEQLEVCEMLEDKLSCAVAHRMIGEAYASLGEYEQALAHQNLHLEGAHEVENLLEEQRAYATLGRTYFCLAEALPENSPKRDKALADAKKAYSKSIRLCNKLDNTNIKLEEMMTMRARLLLNLGLVLEAQGEPQEGVDLIEKSAELCTKHKLTEDLHRTHIALGALHERQGNFNLALEHLDKASQVISLSMKTEALMAKAELLSRIGDWSLARKVLVNLYSMKGIPRDTQRQVEKLLRIVVTVQSTEEDVTMETDPKTRQKLCEKLGDISVAIKSYERAIEYYQEMLNCAEETKEEISAALVSLAQTMQDAGRIDEALPFARRELELCSDSREACRSALFLANLLTRSSSLVDSEIRSTFDLASSKAQECSDSSLEASVLRDLIIYLEKIGQLDEAERVKEKLDRLPITVNESESDSEQESPDIGADICLEDLPDVQESSTSTKRRNKSKGSSTRTGFVVKRNNKGESQLHVACIQGNMKTVERLLAAGHPTNTRDYCGWTPLHEAVNHGFTEVAKLLLQAGADVNDPGGPMCGGVTPLHDAAACGNFSSMNLLIQHGADVKQTAEDGETALDYLEAWRKRVDELSPSEQLDYNHVHQKLSSMLPANLQRSGKSPVVSRDSDRAESDSDSDIKTPRKRISAGEDYKRTIESLKNRASVMSASVKRSSAQKVTAPLLDCNQVTADEWLEDDFDIPEVINESPGSAKRKSQSEIKDHDKQSKRRRINSSESVDHIIGDLEIVDSDNDMLETTDSAESFRKSRRRPKQISLLTAGFTRDSSTRTPSPQLEEAAPVHLLRLEVRLEERLLKLTMTGSEREPVTVAKVINEVQNTFEKDTGCKTTLRLINERVLEPATVLKGSQSGTETLQLSAEVIDMTVPPINERYEMICRANGIGIRDQLIDCLKECERSTIFRLRHCALHDRELSTLLTCLEYQSQVQVLDMSRAVLFRHGKLISRIVSKWSSLRELHLYCCDLDHDALMQFTRLPMQLEVLDLSYNPLGPGSSAKLYELISPLSRLKELNLCHCEIDDFSFDLSIESLVSVNVSWNSMSEAGVSRFLQRNLHYLNLSGVEVSNGLSVAQALFRNVRIIPESLQCLEMGFCNILDSDVAEVLSRYPNLNRLVLTGNTGLTVNSVRAVLNYKHTLRYVDLGGCTEVNELPDQNLLGEEPVLLTMTVSIAPRVLDSWKALWRGLKCVHTMINNVVIFNPDTQTQRRENFQSDLGKSSGFSQRWL
ncbi:tonsoku-like protein [Orussus abietinus]|uniref:tonsoku-like protein n=1 Tax=Orussus abietinus TaxID=222816 RepID=UPI000625319A|nr:tonsoku-like protein [Orussus abietinus]